MSSVSELVSIGQAAQMIGVAVSTLRRWEQEDKFAPASRTLGGHRRYLITAITTAFFPEAVEPEKTTVAYARVSSHDQKGDLSTQIARLSLFCGEKDYPFEIISDLGSGLNYQKRGLQKLLQMILRKEVGRLVLTHKDRLLRFGSGLLFQVCAHFGTEIIVLDDAPARDFNEELTSDLVEIITVFSSRLYGKRSHANRTKLKKAA